jgi:hypothetical protein
MVYIGIYMLYRFLYQKEYEKYALCETSEIGKQNII